MPIPRFFQNLPDVLPVPLHIGGLEVGTIVLLRSALEAALKLEAMRRLWPAIEARTVSGDAVAMYQTAVDRIAEVHRDLMLVGLLSRGEHRGLWDQYVDRCLQPLSQAGKGLRFCAICGAILKKSRAIRVTCSKPLCRRGYRKAKEIARSRKRDSASDKRRYRENQHVRALTAAIRPPKDTPSPPLPDSLSSIQGAARAFVTPGKTAEQNALKQWLKNTRRKDAVPAIRRARIYRSRRSRTS